MLADKLQQPRNQSPLAFSQTAPLGECRSSQRKAREWRDVGVHDGDRVLVELCQIQSVPLLAPLDTCGLRDLHMDLAGTTTSNLMRLSALNPLNASKVSRESKRHCLSMRWSMY